MSTEAESQDIPNSTPINDGMECDTKEIYEVKRDRMGNIIWLAKYPDDVEDAAENQEIASYAILAIDNEKDEDTRAHIVLLQKVLEPELKDVTEARIDYIENKVITYDHLRTILQPGCILYKQIWGRDSAVKFAGGFAINNEKKHTAEIGTLPIFPLEFHPDGRKIKAKTSKRGKLFEQYRGYHFRYYKYFAIGEDPECGCPIKVTVDSRIIVDTHAYCKFNPEVSSLKALDHKRASEIVDLESDCENDE
ncbi:hypothetical protein ACHAQE_004204 [Botrytis cinerea]